MTLSWLITIFQITDTKNFDLRMTTKDFGYLEIGFKQETKKFFVSYITEDLDQNIDLIERLLNA